MEVALIEAVSVLLWRGITTNPVNSNAADLGTVPAFIWYQAWAKAGPGFLGSFTASEPTKGNIGTAQQIRLH